MNRINDRSIYFNFLLCLPCKFPKLMFLTVIEKALHIFRNLKQERNKSITISKSILFLYRYYISLKAIHSKIEIHKK